MDKEPDIRWQQRFENYQRALVQLTKAVTLSEERELNDLEKQGLIQAFEYTHELAWKVMKDFLTEKGTDRIFGSKDATRLAFKNEIIMDGEIWMEMIKDRNLSSHTYNEDVSEKISRNILEHYASAFQDFSSVMESFKEEK